MNRQYIKGVSSPDPKKDTKRIQADFNDKARERFINLEKVWNSIFKHFFYEILHVNSKGNFADEAFITYKNDYYADLGLLFMKPYLDEVITHEIEQSDREKIYKLEKCGNIKKLLKSKPELEEKDFRYFFVAGLVYNIFYNSEDADKFFKCSEKYFDENNGLKEFFIIKVEEKMETLENGTDEHKQHAKLLELINHKFSCITLPSTIQSYFQIQSNLHKFNNRKRPMKTGLNINPLLKKNRDFLKQTALLKKSKHSTCPH